MAILRCCDPKPESSQTAVAASGESAEYTSGFALPSATARTPLTASSWVRAMTTDRERPWLRCASARPMSARGVAAPSSDSSHSSRSAAALRRRDGRNPESTSGTTDPSTAHGAKPSAGSTSTTSAGASSFFACAARTARSASVRKSSSSSVSTGSTSEDDSTSGDDPLVELVETTPDRSLGSTSRTTTCALVPPKPKPDTPATA